jgi:hypothetical protein
MGVNSANAIRFASNGTVYVAPTATAGPTDVTTALPATWKQLGYVSDAGVSLTPSITTQAINAWQSATPVKYLVTAASFQVGFTLLQFDKEAVELYFGSSFVQAMDDEDAPIVGVFVLDLASTPDLIETSLVVEWSDSTVKNRLWVPRCQVSSREALTLVRTSGQNLGVTLDALDQGGKLGSIFTDAAVGA